MAAQGSVEHPPDKYQQAVIDRFLNGNVHIIVEAVAGSGKTKTLKKCVLPDKKTLYVCFNKSIASDTDEEFKKAGLNVEALTTHSVATSVTMSIFHESLKGRGLSKTKKFEAATAVVPKSVEGYKKLRPMLCQLASLVQQTVTDPKDLPAVSHLIRLHLAASQSEEKSLLSIIEHFMTKLANLFPAFDFDDALWMPLNFKAVAPLMDEAKVEAKFHKYDVILLDELQDVTPLQLNFILKCLKPSGTILAVGDRRQCIYSFMGSSETIFDELNKRLRLTGKEVVQLPLSVVYRCPKSHVTLAKRLVNHLEAGRNDEGVLESTTEGVMLRDVNPQSEDLVMCRSNKKMLKICGQLLRLQKPVVISNMDDVKTMLQTFLNGGENGETQSDRAARATREHKEKEEELKKTGEDFKVLQYWATMYECAAGLGEWWKQEDGTYPSNDDLISKINSVFPDETPKLCVNLSTVHSAKGMTKDTVWFVAEDMHGILDKYKDKSEEVKTEVLKSHCNVLYVALTRARKRLFIVDRQIDDIFSDVQFSPEPNVAPAKRSAMSAVATGNNSPLKKPRECTDMQQ